MADNISGELYVLACQTAADIVKQVVVSDLTNSGSLDIDKITKYFDSCKKAIHKSIVEGLEDKMY